MDDGTWAAWLHLLAMHPRVLIEEELTRSIIGAFFEVYNTMGHGFLEHLYVMALERELLSRGHGVARELCVRVTYKGHPLGSHRLDMVVDGKVIVETKSTSALPRFAARQLFNYLKATHLEVGLLLHFGPEATFHRMICRSTRIGPPNPSDPSNLPNPSNPSS